MNGVERSNDGVVLRRCPFCGGEVDIKEQTHFCNEKMYYVECRNNLCATMPSTEFCSSKEEAIKAWNTRTPVDKVIERLEETRGEIRELAEATLLCFDDDNNYHNFANINYGIHKAIEIIKEEMM